MSGLGMVEKCPACGKTVYFAERVAGIGGVGWHKACYRCVDCKSTLTAGKENDVKDHGAVCQSCYNKNHRPKGYGFGAGGTIDSFQNKGKSGKSAGKR